MEERKRVKVRIWGGRIVKICISYGGKRMCLKDHKSIKTEWVHMTYNRVRMKMGYKYRRNGKMIRCSSGGEREGRQGKLYGMWEVRWIVSEQKQAALNE